MVVDRRSLRAGAPLDPADHARVVRKAIFHCFKWDPQMEDVPVLAPFPLLLDAEAWRTLSADAEALAAETVAAEIELLSRPDLHLRLGLPCAVARALRHRPEPAADIARVMRFDFHLTTDGWRISEVNSDVPGGYIEAGAFTHLIAEHCPDCPAPPDPAERLGQAFADRLAPGAAVALVHATAYTDDRQVMLHLARHLEQAGLRPVLLSPAQVDWRNRRAFAHADFAQGPIDAIFRFYPAEWLVSLPRRTDWPMFLAGSLTPLSSPGTALLTQSKRFPLAWDELRTPLPAWRRLLPETRDPREANWRNDPAWLLKPAMGRVGEAIGMHGVTQETQWRKLARSARWFPRHWAAQRRFEAIPVQTPDGPQYPCIGVYTIAGRAAGIYGRLAAAPLVDCRARDIAVLLTDPVPACRKAHHAPDLSRSRV